MNKFFILASLILIVVLGVFSDPKNAQSSPEETLAGLLTLQGNSLLPNSVLPEPKVVRTVNIIATAYSSTPEQTDDDPFITAAGTMVRDGIVANNLLPFGTKIRLPELYGEKIFVVEDRMHSRKGNYHFDVWFPSYWEAKEFGAKITYVEILEN